jgi:hypothetical protein
MRDAGDDHLAVQHGVGRPELPVRRLFPIVDIHAPPAQLAPGLTFGAGQTGADQDVNQADAADELAPFDRG